MADVAHPKQGFAYMLDVLHHLTLPALTLAIVYVAQYSRLSRTSMIDVLHADYIRTDRKSTRLNSSHYCESRMPSTACKQKNHQLIYIQHRTITQQSQNQ